MIPPAALAAIEAAIRHVQHVTVRRVRAAIEEPTQ